jgi:CheY-like chemotaxis protein
MENQEQQITSTTKAGTYNAPKQILVVDDCEDMIELQRTILESEGYTVLTAQSGSEAYVLLSQNEKMDLILLDMVMKDMSGSEFLDFLQEKNPDLLDGVPVVFVTGMDQVPKSRNVGFVQKPIADINKFLITIHQFIEENERVRNLQQTEWYQ